MSVLLARHVYFSRGLLDTHMFSASGVAATYRCLASFYFLCLSSSTGSSQGPEELQQCSPMFSGRSKKYHNDTYTTGLRTSTRHYQHNILSSKTLPHRHPPFRIQIDSSPSASVHHLAFAPHFSGLCPRSGAFTPVHCTHTLVASILCGPGHVLVVWFGHA
jgi:hypothetical protein